MGYRDSDDSGFSRHGMNRDNSEHHSHDPLQHQRSQRAGFDHPDLDRDEDLRTSHSVPLDYRPGRNEAYGGRRDGQSDQGARAWEGRDTWRDAGRDRYQGQGGSYRNHDTGYGYGARSPDIGGYDPYESEQRYRQQPYGGYGGNGDRAYGSDDRARLNRPDGGWAREGHGGHGRGDQDNPGYHGRRQGRSYGYGYDGRPDGGSGYDDRQDAYGDRYQDQDRQPGSYNNAAHYRGSSQRHDPEYAAWRQEQLRLLDEDYDSWRNERYQKFSEEFNTWRSSRSRNEGLRGSNQSGQVTTQNASSTTGTTGRNQQPGGSATGTASTAGGSATASGKSNKD